MSDNTKKKWMYWVLLAIGLCCPIVSRIFHLTPISGYGTFIWLYVFLELACRYRSKKETLLTGAVFIIGYSIFFAGALGNALINVPIFVVSGLVIYLAFCASGHLMARWNHFPLTLAFPVIWLIEYGIATLLHVPSMARVDMMFTNLSVLMQAERLIGSAGLSLMILWIISILVYAHINHKDWCTILAIVLCFALLLPGMVYLSPNLTEAQTVRVAYTTGPYIGDYIDYEPVSYEINESSMVNAIQGAAEQNAEILVFNEEAFQIDDIDEARMLEKCAALSKETGLAVLLGLDVTDTDNSEDGQSLNKVVFFDNNGEMLGSYQKACLIPIIESGYKAGSGNIPSHTLNLNGKEVKISYLICYDSNFPGYVKQIDKDTDILFLPSWDWSAITELHSKLCSTLAVENQISILKPTYDGLSIAINPDGTFFHTSSTDETGYEQIHMVDMPIKSTYQTVERADMTGAMIYAIAATEIMSVFISVLLLIVSRVRTSESTKRSRWFNVLAATTLAGCLADALSWILDGCTRLLSVLYISSTIGTLVTILLVGLFISYLSEYVNERRQISKKPVIITWIYIGAVSVLTLIAILTGQLFTFENGVFEEVPLYTAYVIVNAASLLIGTAVIFMYRKSMDASDRFIAHLYMFIPLLAGIVNLFLEEWSFTYPAITLSLVLIFAMLQSEKMERLEHEGRIVSYHATHDELTGLYNRRAFRDRVETLKVTPGESGVVFGDLNGLKYANDNFGHEAGDQLLIDYADILSGIFRMNETYRISGDEFICLMENVPESILNERFNELLNIVKEKDPPIASLGFAFGKNGDIEELVKQAEAMMYKDKEIVHRNHPELNR